VIVKSMSRGFLACLADRNVCPTGSYEHPMLWPQLWHK
jgi:hypothetical protein